MGRIALPPPLGDERAIDANRQAGAHRLQESTCRPERELTEMTSLDRRHEGLRDTRA